MNANTCFTHVKAFAQGTLMDWGCAQLHLIQALVQKPPWIHALGWLSPWGTHLYMNLTYNINLEHVPQPQQ